MTSFRVTGGKNLKGNIIPQGAKNEALQVIAAALLTEEPVIIHKIPNIRDVNKLIELLAFIGVEVDKLGPESYRFVANHVDINLLTSTEIKEKALDLRGSIMILGPLLARFGKGSMPKPGGDKIGVR